MPARVVVSCLVAASLAHSAGTEQDSARPDMARLFHRLDDLGRDKVAEAVFVEIVFQEGTEVGWFVGEGGVQPNRAGPRCGSRMSRFCRIVCVDRVLSASWRRQLITGADTSHIAPNASP